MFGAKVLKRSVVVNQTVNLCELCDLDAVQNKSPLTVLKVLDQITLENKLKYMYLILTIRTSPKEEAT